jgi:hypothetical protein
MRLHLNGVDVARNYRALRANADHQQGLLSVNGQGLTPAQAPEPGAASEPSAPALTTVGLHDAAGVRPPRREP